MMITNKRYKKHLSTFVRHIIGVIREEFSIGRKDILVYKKNTIKLVGELLNNKGVRIAWVLNGIFQRYYFSLLVQDRE